MSEKLNQLGRSIFQNTLKKPLPPEKNFSFKLHHTETSQLCLGIGVFQLSSGRLQELKNAYGNQTSRGHLLNFARGKIYGDLKDKWRENADFNQASGVLTAAVEGALILTWNYLQEAEEIYQGCFDLACAAVAQVNAEDLKAAKRTAEQIVDLETAIDPKQTHWGPFTQALLTDLTE